MTDFARDQYMEKKVFESGFVNLQRYSKNDIEKY